MHMLVHEGMPQRMHVYMAMHLASAEMLRELRSELHASQPTADYQC